jgi:hypothetical protein
MHKAIGLKFTKRITMQHTAVNNKKYGLMTQVSVCRTIALSTTILSL